MNQLPISISLLFAFTTLITVGIFFEATKYHTKTLFILLGWLVLQTIIGLTGFYTITDHVPPRFVLLIWPPLIFILILFLTAKGRAYIDRLDLKTLTLLHTIRIPVEIVLFGLFIHKTIPELMTFEGRNFDILSGLTAPLVFYFGFIKNKLSNKVILGWNFICLALLINIVINAVLSAPFPIQQFAFDQPNIALLYFPFIWLPCCVVPIVLLSHLVAIRKLLTTV